MTWLAWLLLGVGTADLLGAARPGLPRWAPTALGGLVVVTVAGLGSPMDAAAALFAALVVGAVALWRLLLPGAEAGAVPARRALAGLVLPAAVLLALSGWATPVTGPLAAWLEWLDLPALRGFDPGRILLLAALALANTATANHVVRLVLVSIHATPPRMTQFREHFRADEPQESSGSGHPEMRSEPHTDAPPSERLRGGRLLGPMERLLILGLGAAGYVEAAGLVVAAKGLLRFPELQAAARRPSGAVDEVTEYFLVGTFTSLLVALASVVLLA